MRLMSFFHTKEQILARTKTVTRRKGWEFLIDETPGYLIQPVEKGMGLRKGDTIVKLGGPISLVGARREPYERMLDEPEYGRSECIAEGFPDWTPERYVKLILTITPSIRWTRLLTRVEFGYTDA